MAIAGWFPHLGWLAPPAAPGSTSPARLKATTLALAAARQSLDKLANEISKLDAQQGMCRGEGLVDKSSRNARWRPFARSCSRRDQSSIINARGPLEASHSLNLDQRRRPETLRTAIATAFF
jgi:hypothetical protein